MEAPGRSRLLLAIPASTHGLYYGPIELAPGGPGGWCEGGTQALLQHLEQRHSPTVCRGKERRVIPEGRKASLHSTGEKTEAGGLVRAPLLPEQDSAPILGYHIVPIFPIKFEAF